MAPCCYEASTCRLQDFPSNVLQAALLPKLTVRSLLALATSSKHMQELVMAADASIWSAAATQGPAPFVTAMPTTVSAILKAFQTSWQASKSLEQGRSVTNASLEPLVQGWTCSPNESYLAGISCSAINLLVWESTCCKLRILLWEQPWDSAEICHWLPQSSVVVISEMLDGHTGQRTALKFVDVATMTVTCSIERPDPDTLPAMPTSLANLLPHKGAVDRSEQWCSIHCWHTAR